MNKEHKSDKCKVVVHWIIQVLTWAALIVGLIAAFSSSKNKTLIIVICLVVYLLYIIVECSSHTPQFLCNKKTIKSCKEYLGQLFGTPPTITFSGECFHYVKITKKYSDGHKETKLEKVITDTPSEDMVYYSFRDISGLFQLNKDKATIMKKKYIKLHLDYKISFNDPITWADYVYQKYLFLQNNQYRDTNFSFYENWFIKGFEELIMVKIAEDDPCSVNFFWFFLFTILPFAELYKIYVESLSIHQEFTIKKTISTRYDLNSPEIAPQYQSTVPQINLIVQSYTFSVSEYTRVNSTVNVVLPTEEELKEAEKYRGKITPSEEGKNTTTNNHNTQNNNDNPIQIQSDASNNDLENNNNGVITEAKMNQDNK